MAPQSPDLNPIENLWAIIKSRRQKKYGVPATKEDIITQVFDIWTSIELELLETLADSAINRFKACILSQGGMTKY